MSNRPARWIARRPDSRPKQFEELANADHVVAHSRETVGLTGERDALAIVDRVTCYLDCSPLMLQSAEDAHGAMLELYAHMSVRPS